MNKDKRSAVQNGHRVRDTFEKIKNEQKLTERDFKRLKWQLRKESTAKLSNFELDEFKGKDE